MVFADWVHYPILSLIIKLGHIASSLMWTGLKSVVIDTGNFVK